MTRSLVPLALVPLSVKVLYQSESGPRRQGLRHAVTLSPASLSLPSSLLCETSPGVTSLTRSPSIRVVTVY